MVYYSFSIYDPVLDSEFGRQFLNSLSQSEKILRRRVSQYPRLALHVNGNVLTRHSLNTEVQ